MSSSWKLLARSAVALLLSINSISAAIASDTAAGKYFKYPHPFQRSDGKWGYVNSSHCWVISPEFDNAVHFREGLAGVWSPRGPVFGGFIDITGRILFHAPLSADQFSGGLAKTSGPTQNTIRMGFIDKTGRLAIKLQFDEAKDFSEGLAAVGIGDNVMTRKWGFIDKTSKFVINPQFDEVGSFSEGLALVRIDNLYGYIDRAGILAIAANFESAGEYRDGLANVRAGGKWGYIDKIGDFVIKPEFDEVYAFREGFAAVKIYGKWGFINKTGKVIINPSFDEVQSFNEGLAVFNIDGKWGYIDSMGRTFIKPQFSGAFSFNGGLASVTVGSGPYGGKFYLINRSGTVLLDPTC